MNNFEFGALLGLIFVAVYFAYGLGKEAGKREGIHLTNKIDVDAELIVAALKGYGYHIVRDEAAEKRTEN